MGAAINLLQLMLQSQDNSLRVDSFCEFQSEDHLAPSKKKNEKTCIIVGINLLVIADFDINCAPSPSIISFPNFWKYKLPAWFRLCPCS